MLDHWNISEPHRIAFVEACKEAANNLIAFDNFRRNDLISMVIENCNQDSGNAYLAFVSKYQPFLLRYFNRFVTSERFGNPPLGTYNGFQMAHTTLRYIKTLADLHYHFGSLNDLNIVEIGGGYGGQCKIIHDVFVPASYTVYDLPEVQLLSKTFLLRYDILIWPAPSIKECFDDNDSYDLVIANYSWSELDTKLRSSYIEQVIAKSKAGYLTLNYDMDIQIEELKKALPDKEFILRDLWDINKESNYLVIFK